MATDIIPNCDDSTKRPNRLERFEESLKRVNPPSWMKEACVNGTKTKLRAASPYSARPEDSNPTEAAGAAATQSRIRYSDYKRAVSASSTHRYSGSSTSSSQWNHRPPSATRTPLSVSREPSPSPYGTASSKYFQGAFCRWSTSTLCDSAYSGNNTPTESLMSGRSTNCSNRSLLQRANASHQRHYMGWRSQDNLLENGRMSTPNERMGYSLRRSQLASGPSTGSVRSCGSSYYPNDPVPNYSQSLPRSMVSDQLVHDSIRSVSSAIMEFCKADEVPLPPPDPETIRRRHRSKDHHQRSKVVWLESSFVSAADSNSSTKSKLWNDVTVVQFSGTKKWL